MPKHNLKVKQPQKDFNDEPYLVLLQISELLCKSGAETRLIVQTTERVAKAYDLNIRVVVSPEMISILDLDHHKYYFSNQFHIGINMGLLTNLVRLCISAEHHELSFPELKEKLSSLKAKEYPSFLLVIMIAIATAAFAYLNGAGLYCCMAAFFAGGITMMYRLICQKLKAFPIFVFSTSGFIATLLAYFIASKFLLLASDDLKILVAVSVLLLVPGFPFINGILDVVKGYITMGIVRLVNTTILLLSVSIGVSMALLILQ